MDELDGSFKENNNLESFNSAREIWESNSSESPSKVLENALSYLEKLPPLEGTGPSVTILLDHNTSKFKAVTGQFKEVFGMEYKYDMNLSEIVPFFYPWHNDLIAKHFHTYINHLLSLNVEQRNDVDLTIIFKYRRGLKYYWLSFRAFRFFSDNRKNIGYGIIAFTDITEIKKNNLAKYILYDKQEGYLVNETLSPHSFRLESLTRTELAIVQLISQGLSDKEVAAKRGSSIETIKNHKRHIYPKLNINKATELVALAYDSGLAQAE